LIEFSPIEPIVNAIVVLTQALRDKMQALYENTGLSDIIRGSSNPNETLGAQKIKAGFAGTRLQTDQDEVARYASEILQVRAEIIQKHFDVKTIIERSNIMRTADAQDKIDKATGQSIPGSGAQFVQQAAAMLKEKGSEFRVSVKADSIAIKDYAALKAERTETLTALGGFLAQTAPLVPAFPPLGPFTLKASQWLLASTKGSQQLEADFDQMVAQATEMAKAAMQPKPPLPPDPKVIAEGKKAEAQVKTAEIGVQKAGIDLTKARVDLVGDLAKAAMPKPAPGDPRGIA
jgi:hypothetical protein